MRLFGIKLFVLGVLSSILAFAGTNDDEKLVKADLVRKLLIERVLFQPADLIQLDEGKIVVKAIPTKDKQIVSVFGIVRLADISAVSMDAFRASLTQRGNKAMKGGAKFSEPPVIDDLNDLELVEKDFKVLRKCVPGDCDLNMSAESIKKLGAEIDWNAPDHKERVTAMLRDMLFRYVSDYAAGGDRSLGSYSNRKEPVDLAVSHRMLLTDSLFANDLSPEVVGYFTDFPNRQLNGAASEMHWSTVDFGLKPAITLTHTLAFDGSQNGVRRFVVANKQIYASRYLDASLSFTMLVGTGANEPGGYLIFTDRSQSDALDGLLSGVARSVVEREAVEKVKGVLQNAELRLIAGNKPSEPAEGTPDGPSIGSQLVGWFRQPIGIVVLLTIAGAAIFAFFRSIQKGRQE